MTSERKFKVGDRVHIVGEGPGTVDGVESPDYDGELVYYVQMDEGGRFGWLEERQLKPLLMFSEGDSVEFKGPPGSFEEGLYMTGVVEEVDAEDEALPYRVRGSNGGDYWCRVEDILFTVTECVPEAEGGTLEAEMPTLREMLQQVRGDAEAEILEAEESLARNRDLITDIDTALHALQG